MCGIFGEFYFNNQDIKIHQAIQRLHLLSHRGPDGFGVECGDFQNNKQSIVHNPEKNFFNTVQPNNYFLGHRRLSIVDLNETALQPMETIDKQYSIVFNGEIYNYIELKETLLKDGCRFKTDHSDTEILLNAYAKWGVSCLEHLRGMFAFCIFDRRNQTLFLARDRIGQKTLYYEFSQERFAFSSEILPLLDPEAKKTINLDALSCYMAFGYVPHPLSIFNGVHKLAPATFALINLRERKIVLERYWNILLHDDKELSGQQFQDNTELLFSESIDLRLRADVPVGAFISGGIDSTLVVKKIHEVGGKKFDIFGADFPQPEQSERVFIEEVSKRYSQNLHLSMIDLDHAQRIDQIIKVFDEPFDGGSSIALFELFKIAGKSYKVILTGDGGDEMFAGYPRYQIGTKHRLLHFLRTMHFPRIAVSLLSALTKNVKVEKLNKLLKGDTISNYLLFNTQLDLTKLVLNHDKFQPDKLPLFQGVMDKIKGADISLPKALQYLEVNSILPGRMLYKLDRFSMHYGVEARSPFLDHKLVEMAFTIPTKFNFDKNETKQILKKILAKDFRPDFVYRKKHGFGNPLSSWFKNSRPETIFRILQDPNSLIFHYLDYPKLHEYFPCIKTGYQGTQEKNLWRLLVLAHFLNFNKKYIAP